MCVKCTSLSLKNYRKKLVSCIGLGPYLRLWMDEADSLLVDGHEQELGVVGIRRLLDLEEGRPKGGPPEDHLQECDLGILRTHTRVLVE